MEYPANLVAITPFDSFWVCEKTDGVRVLLLILWNAVGGEQDTFLVSMTSISHRNFHL